VFLRGIKTCMPFDVDHFQKPFQKLGKLAKKSRKLDDPERVHKLRTNTRRVEAILHALELDTGRKQKRLLKSLKSVRKSAGDVRDMDVLTGKVAQVSVPGERNCQIRLLEHLGMERHRKAADLQAQLASHGKSIRQGLKRCAEKLELASTSGSEEQEQAESRATASVLQLSGGLEKFGKLGRRNLHQYRIQGKQLRYVLQMAKPADAELVNALRETQDAIGEWHDWKELIGIAKEVLEHGSKCELLRGLQQQADDAFDEGLRVAISVRNRFLNSGQKRRNPAPLRIVQASAKIAA
jgi:CHAD domain-containing protein